MKLSESAKEARSDYSKKYRAAMTPEAREAARIYLKEWRSRNRAKVHQYNCDYWERKAGNIKAETIESRVLAMDKQGRSLREIGAELSISHMKVSRILKDCNRL